MLKLAKEWGISIVIAVVATLLIRQFVFTPIIVDGQSMMPTLNNNDRMIVNELSYKIGEPNRFDIIVFKATPTEDYIKRVIGLPGDKIEYKKDVLYVNGVAYDEPYLDSYKKQLSKGQQLTYDFSLDSLEVTHATTVPAGNLFVMGDNRLHSSDSRMIGFVPIDKVLGKTNLIFYPLSDIKIQH